MNKRTASIVLASTLALGTAGVALTPALADTAPGQRVTKIKDALSGLVKDGTLTQAQADKVATTLDEKLPERRHGGPRGAQLKDAVEALGVTPQELRTALESGKSLADVAATKGISRDALVAKLVTAAKTHLAEEVTEGDLTQAQADARLADLTTRIGQLVDRKGLPERGFGHRRGDRRGGPTDGPAAVPGSLQG